MEASSSARFLSSLLFLLAFIINMHSISAARILAAQTSTGFIKKSCGTTLYPQLCINSLTSHANAIHTNPRLLANTALSITVANAHSASAEMSSLSQSHGLKPIEVAAMGDCMEMMGDSVDRLQKSMGEMNKLSGSNFGLMMNNVQTWVSAALTDDDTCMDGLTESASNPSLKGVVRQSVENIAHMTSNALCLINNYASLRG